MSTLGAITWSSLQGQTLFTCGCRQITGPPVQLIMWCGQPDCLRLFQANVAYDDRQFAWQTAHGGSPTQVAGLARYMRTPLPQTVPPPANPLSSELDSVPLSDRHAPHAPHAPKE